MGYEITYPWVAYFRDGSTLSQFGPDGSETLFRKILDRCGDLERFQVGPITVDLRDGSFTMHGIKLTGSSCVENFEEWGIDERIPKRLIYFRRVARKFGIGDVAKEEAVCVVYAVGWQATLNGRNVKHILYLHPDGHVVFA